MHTWTRLLPLPPPQAGEAEGPRFDVMCFNNYWLYYNTLNALKLRLTVSRVISVRKEKLP